MLLKISAIFFFENIKKKKKKRTNFLTIVFTQLKNTYVEITNIYF